MFGNCGECACFIEAKHAGPREIGAPRQGVCALHPPSPVPVQLPGQKTPGNPQGVAFVAYPIRPPVMDRDGCGQWQAKQA